MRLLLLTALVVVAFGSNSILNRVALEGDHIGPSAFAAIRLFSGAVALTLMVYLRDRQFARVSWLGAGSLLLYILGFSFAYVTLPTGIGALILFGGVQITMFAGGLISREPASANRWIGAGIAFAGLVWLMWPSEVGFVDPLGAFLMAAAALGWGVYSLNGRGVENPLAATAMNFAVATPFCVLALLVFPDVTSAGGFGIGLAVLSGVVTSGLGYALWYAVLPELGAMRAGVAQLTAPVVAVAGGMILLAEPLTLRFVLSALLILGGVAISVMPARQRMIGSKGS